MANILENLSHCIEFGKINLPSPYPPEMKGKEGADELALKALDEGINPQEVLMKGLMPGMERTGVKFRENKVFVPQVLMSAKAMNAAMKHLKPHFLSGAATQKGTFIIGTVMGDLHDIGKNLVGMMVEGSGYKVVDLGTDVTSDKFISAIKEHPEAAIGLSALLTTTMVNMEEIIQDIKKAFPDTLIAIGGAPVNEKFRQKVGADHYSLDAQELIKFLNEHG